MFVCRDDVSPIEAEETKVLMAERSLDVGHRVARAREESALTQVELAERSGVNEITISNIERGRQKPAARTLRKLAAALGMEVRDLTVGGEARFPGGAENEKHLDVVLDHEDKLRKRHDTEREGNEPRGSDT